MDAGPELPSSERVQESDMTVTSASQETEETDASAKQDTQVQESALEIKHQADDKHVVRACGYCDMDTTSNLSSSMLEVQL